MGGLVVWCVVWCTGATRALKIACPLHVRMEETLEVFCATGRSTGEDKIGKVRANEAAMLDFRHRTTYVWWWLCHTSWVGMVDRG